MSCVKFISHEHRATISMDKLFLQIYLFLFHIILSTIGVEQPRMVFTEKETSIIRRRFFGAPSMEILAEKEDAVALIGTTKISLIDFNNPQKITVKSVHWDECKDAAQKNDCDYNISIVHKSHEDNHIFVCGSNGREIACCNMNISEYPAKCMPSDKVNSIRERIRYFNINEGQTSAFVESSVSAELYIADSGSQGIHKLGKHSVRPAHHDEEQRYVKLIVSKQDRINDVIQDKIYGFYNVKSTDMHSHMWTPYVTQICMTDIGGPKNNLQLTWTSQLNAQLFCGDMEQRQHFSELLDVATVEADHWQDTRVYGLFQNEWGMRAVCVYTIHDIAHVFKTSPFKNSSEQLGRPRTCVADSTKLGFEILKQIEANCKMENPIQPINSRGPIVISSHHYTQITAHDLQDKHHNNQTIMFLSLRNGAIHKLKHQQSDREAFIIAEYKPFNHKTHIVSMRLNSFTKKLYVTSGTEVAQVDVANCQSYGEACEECVLARDPYCAWSQGHCLCNGTLQDTEHGNISICPNSTLNPTPSKVHRQAADKDSDTADQISVPRGSRYFLECPVSSLHAQYSWYHNNRPVPCSGEKQQCLLLISSLEPEQEGTYSCESEEQGHSRVLAQYQLSVSDGAEACSPGRVLWVGLLAALLFHR